MVVANERLKTIQKLTMFGPKVVAYKRWSLTRSGRLREIPTIVMSPRKNFGILEKWPLTKGGHLREVVALEGSIVSNAIG